MCVCECVCVLVYLPWFCYQAKTSSKNDRKKKRAKRRAEKSVCKAPVRVFYSVNAITWAINFWLVYTSIDTFARNPMSSTTKQIASNGQSDTEKTYLNYRTLDARSCREKYAIFFFCILRFVMCTRVVTNGITHNFVRLFTFSVIKCSDKIQMKRQQKMKKTSLEANRV